MLKLYVLNIQGADKKKSNKAHTFLMKCALQMNASLGRVFICDWPFLFCPWFCRWCRTQTFPAGPGDVCTPQRQSQQTRSHPIITGESASSAHASAEDSLFLHAHINHVLLGSVTAGHITRTFVSTTKERSPHSLSHSVKPWRPEPAIEPSGGRKLKNSRGGRQRRRWCYTD